MHGVIAGGSEPTVDAGAAILAAGGNAVDAAVGACFATAVGEPTLTSLAGGGMMIHRSASGDVHVCDMFSDAPQLRNDDVENLEFYGAELDFGPTTQEFFIGNGSAAAPGVLPGLCSVLDKWGSLPLSDVIAPACRMMRDGCVLGPYQGRAAKLLEPILTRTESGRGVFATRGRMIAAGDRFVLPQLADTLEALAAADDWQAHYREVIGEMMLAQFGPEHGGLLTAADLDDYEILFREPIELRYHDATVLTMPPPAAGGTMIAMMLQLLHGVQLGDHAPSSPEHTRLLATAMAIADESRVEGAAALAGERFEHWRARYHQMLARPRLHFAPSQPAPPGTTHVSVLDADGNAAAITFSYGEGNAHIIGNTGIMMNNLMGEADLFPAGFGSAPPGKRLPTMMSPTILIGDDGHITVMGTGGANRIRTAIVQVLSLLGDHNQDPQSAVAAPRVHYEDGVLNAEVFAMDDGGDALAALGARKYVRFPEPNLFFGGVHMVQAAADGTLSGGGDPRRGGEFRIV